MRTPLALWKRGIVHVRPPAKDFKGVFELPPLVTFPWWRGPGSLWELPCIKVFLATCQEVALGKGGLALPKGVYDGLLQRRAFQRPFSPDLDHHIKGEFHL